MTDEPVVIIEQYMGHGDYNHDYLEVTPEEARALNELKILLKKANLVPMIEKLTKEVYDPDATQQQAAESFWTLFDNEAVVCKECGKLVLELLLAVPRRGFKNYRVCGSCKLKLETPI